MIKLSQSEELDFTNYIAPVLSQSLLGTPLYFPSSFFNHRTVSPRIARYIWEQTAPGGLLSNILSRAGNLAKHGYTRI